MTRTILLLICFLFILSGCGQPNQASPSVASATPPQPASSPVNLPSPPPATTSPANAANAKIIDLTPNTVAKLRPMLQKMEGTPYLCIGVTATENCTGYRYELDLKSELTPPNAVVTTVDGIQVAIAPDDVAFLKGTTLDYLAQPGGFVFNTPHPDTSLLREYREKQAAEERQRLIDMELVKSVDPVRSVAELLTPRRQAAYEQLQLWWKFNQPAAHSEYYTTVGRVDRYHLPDGQWLTVVFRGEPDQQQGAFCLIQDDGRQSLPFHGQNLIDEDDQFLDVNGDGLPEIVAVQTMGHHAKDDKKRIACEGTSLDIIPIAAAQTPLLRIIFDPRPFRTESTWRWQLVPSSAASQSRSPTLPSQQPTSPPDSPDAARPPATEPSVQDVILERQQNGKWTTQARFVWSPATQNYQGPSGSIKDGFIASTKSLETADIERFLQSAEVQRN
ncbi:MAG: hypothetical protein JWM11_435 [Planctomycetaceae bacterium]|nr:hypothetical protein [Planctomycetaceae bacterium]